MTDRKDLYRFEHPPLLIVISGTSGAGKDSVARALVKRLEEDGHPAHFVVTATSRPQRAGEVDGVDYVFVSTAEFERMVEEVAEFSRTVQEVLDWASGDEETLVLVTSDHETGGLEVLANNGKGVAPAVSWASDGHTNAPVSVFARGPWSPATELVEDNTDIHLLLLEGDVYGVPHPGGGSCDSGGCFIDVFDGCKYGHGVRRGSTFP